MDFLKYLGNNLVPFCFDELKVFGLYICNGNIFKSFKKTVESGWKFYMFEQVQSPPFSNMQTLPTV